MPPPAPHIVAGYAPIIMILEAQLDELDKMGAHIAAAHLDAAIVHLRRDVLGDISRFN